MWSQPVHLSTSYNFFFLRIFIAISFNIKGTVERKNFHRPGSDESAMIQHLFG